MIKKCIYSSHRALSYLTAPDIVDERVLLEATRLLAFNVSSGLLLLLLVLPPDLSIAEGTCSTPPVSPVEDMVAGTGG